MSTQGSRREDDRASWYWDGDSAVGAVVLRSALLDSVIGLTHGFATRLGGGEGGLDFGANIPAERRAEHRRRLAARVGFEAATLMTARQVHGREVLQVHGAEDPAALRAREADGLLTETPGVAVGVITADCVPVLVADRRGEAVAAVHAGWRGLVLGILAAAVEAFSARGISEDRLVAAVGPCISARAYEVGDEVAEQFMTLDGAGEGGPPSVVSRGGQGRAHVDLGLAAERVLSAAGVRQVSVCGLCTHGDLTRSLPSFHSHRRDPTGGRQLSVVALLGSTRDRAG